MVASFTGTGDNGQPTTATHPAHSGANPGVGGVSVGGVSIGGVSSAVVASTSNTQQPQEQSSIPDGSHADNRVVRVLMGRLGSSKTFGENIIFMLNRAGTFCFSHLLETIAKSCLLLQNEHQRICVCSS